MKSLSDLFELAKRAHQFTSFSPDERGEQMINEYSDELDEDLLTISDDLVKEAYNAGYRKHFSAWLSSKSRCASTMITGGSNFNVRRNEKAFASEGNKHKAFRGWRDRFLAAVKRRAKLESKPAISNDKENQVIKFDMGEVIINYSIDRIQIKHDSKPDQSIIASLKKAAFKWSPSQSVWQRQLTQNAKYATEQLTGVKL